MDGGKFEVFFLDMDVTDRSRSGEPGFYDIFRLDVSVGYYPMAVGYLIYTFFSMSVVFAV